ncbi:MAG: hypothetical protein KC591_18200, partial [Gemmatimonadetes bacterium]|nr:hypothetical protein [Gemmatimonadota bacterium]
MSPERNIGDPLVTRIVDRARARGSGRDPELWLAVGGVLTRYVRRFASDLDPQVQSDIVSEKTLDLLVRYDHGQWSPADWSAARVSAYLRSMARFGVADRIRETSRLRPELPESL